MPRTVGTARAPRNVHLFEVATEVCCKVGGIYQVLRSKVPAMQKRWGARYTLVGPWEERSAAVEFEPRPAPAWVKRLTDRCAEEGLRIHHGRWLVTGRPRVLLVDQVVDEKRLGEIKYDLWQQHGIDCRSGDWALDKAVWFSDCTRRLIAAAEEELASADQRVLAHFHEWLGSLAIPELRRAKVPVATVFTTHATLLGRYIASGEGDFYSRLPHTDHAAEATKFNVMGQHGIERACAHGAHVLTTVSPITGEECTHLLGRKPDTITPNGLNIERFDVGHDLQNLHAECKSHIHDFVMGHFFPSYAFDLDRTIYMFTSGRFEPGNKGFDICLEALARLNAELKAFDLGVTVVFFVVSSRAARSLHPDVLESRGVLNELRRTCGNVAQHLEDQLYRRAAAGEPLQLDSLVEEYWRLRYRRTQQALRRDRLPPVVTHVLDDDATDPVLGQIRRLGLFNWKEDPVKVVYHPEFITPTNPLWGIEYEQFVRGCHLGVFPSAYEPWGYTPLESIASGVPAITSDLAGFGRYVAEKMPDHDSWGINVVRRRGRDYDSAAADLARWLLAFCRLDRRGRIGLRNEVEEHASDFDWSRLVPAYHAAHELALERAADEFGWGAE